MRYQSCVLPRGGGGFLSECSENKLLQSQQHPSEATYDLTSWETRQSRKIHIGQYLFRYDIPIPPHWRSD